jgi:hypothetical protein
MRRRFPLVIPYPRNIVGGRNGGAPAIRRRPAYRRPTRAGPAQAGCARQNQISPKHACFRPDTLIDARLVAALAQLVEHIIRNDGVTGSSPVSGTISPPSAIMLPVSNDTAAPLRGVIANRFRKSRHCAGKWCPEELSNSPYILLIYNNINRSPCVDDPGSAQNFF